jgi:hypothetical protein
MPGPGDRDPRAAPPAPPTPADRLAEADRLAARGELGASREVLAPLEQEALPWRAEALLRLALLDEQEGRPADAGRRWERILADDIDHDRAWVHLGRLRVLQERTPGAATPGLTMVAPTLESAAGVDIGRFEIMRELGRGSSATVYLARDRLLGLELALKVLHPSAGMGEQDRGFFHEARAVAGLRHPGVVAIYDVDEPARTLVMEYIPGGTVRDRLRARAGVEATPRGLPADEVAAMAARLLETLIYVHDRGVVHGDITPRNVLLRAPGQPVLVDFGIARLDDAQAAMDAPAGTPLYLAPEQLRGAVASERTDLYALGALLWEALVGRPLRARADLVAGQSESRPLPAELLPALGGPGGPLPRLIAALTAAAPELRPAGAREARRLLGGAEPCEGSE